MSTCGETTLEAVKSFHRRMMRRRNVSEEKIKQHFLEMDISVDGILESNHGCRKFMMVTVRFGGYIYIHSIHNPLTNNKDAKPTGELLLG